MMLNEDEIIWKNEVLEMARRARLHRNQHNLASNPVQYKFSYDGTEEALIAFAKLVAEKAVEREREACAMACENVYTGEEACGDWPTPEMCAEAIRARGQE